MTAELFIKKIEEINSKLNLILKSEDEFQTLSSRFIGDINGIRGLFEQFIIGTSIKRKDSNWIESGNEIFNLIDNYDLNALNNYVLNFSFNEEIEEEEDDEYLVFAYMDSNIAIRRSDNKICWVDYNTFELLSTVAVSSEIFLDCIIEYINYNIFRESSDVDMVEKLVMMSQCEDSDVFFAYLVGVD